MCSTESEESVMIVISLYDYTGEAVKPWAKAGYECHCYDIQHDGTKGDRFPSGGSIHYLHADLYNYKATGDLCQSYLHKPVVFGMAFPVCTDMAVSGAAWFEAKRKIDPDFQKKAVWHAMLCSSFFSKLRVPFFVENPVSVLSTLWRRPDHMFNPYEYGGYIPEDEVEHPTWPDYIAPRDAYPKKTCLWVGGGFKMPTPMPVVVEAGYSTQHRKLGGKSMKTKNIRSATPRGFAQAVFEANKRP
jgi:hypothetical protein